MSNITLSVTENTFRIDETNSIIQVNSTPTTVVVAEGGGVSVEEVRTALSAVTPILYNNVTGVFSIDSGSLFTGKTTTDLPEGANLYYTIARANTWLTTKTTSDLLEGANLYFTNGRAVSAVNTGNVTLKQYQETYVDAGTTNGNVSLNAANGTIQKITLNGNMTGINVSNLAIGGSFTLLIQQDSFGSRELITTTGWSSWIFANNLKTLSAEPNSFNLLTFTWNGTNYIASLVAFSASGLIQNSELANSSITINGTAVSLGGTRTLNTTDIGEGANLYFTTGRANSAIGAYQGTINTTGNITAANFIGNARFATGIITTNVAEGANLYFTTARANTAIGAYQGSINTPGSVTTGNLTVNGTVNATGNASVANIATTRISPIGANIFIGPIDIPTDISQKITSSRAFEATTLTATNFIETSGYIAATGGDGISTRFGDIFSTNGGNIYTLTGNIIGAYLHGNGSNITGIASNAGVVSYIATQPLTVGGNLTVNGNINATGNINVQNVTDLYVRDQIIVLNANAASNSNVEIISNRPTATSTSLKWNEQATRWEFTNNGTTYFPIATSTTDLAEGSNLYYSTDRANTAIGAYQGSINTAGNITAANFFGSGTNLTGVLTNYSTTDLTEGANLYYTTDRANTAIGAYQGSINTAGNVTAQSATLGRINIPQSDTSNLGIIVNNTRTSGATNPIFTITGAASGLGSSSDWGIQLKSGGNAGEGNGINPDFELQTTDASRGAKLKLQDLKLQLSGGSAANNTIYAQGNITTETGFVGNSLSAITGANAVINTQTALTITTRQGLANTLTTSANVIGEGYAMFTPVGSPPIPLTYTGTTPIKAVSINGTITAGSDTITGVTSVTDRSGATLTIADVKPYMVLGNLSDFGANAYVVSASGTSVTMSRPAVTSTTLSNGGTFLATSGLLLNGAVDTVRGFSFVFLSAFDNAAPMPSPTILQNTFIQTPGVYGYARTGPAVGEFVYSAGTSSDYAFTSDLQRYMFGRTAFSIDNKSVLNAPRGLVVGSADMTNRAENDLSSTGFGINVLYDGTANVLNDYGQSGPNAGIFPQILLKSYTDGTSQGGSAARNADAGPRLMFINSFGNRNRDPFNAYARTNYELGRVTFWTSAAQLAPSSIAPPAFISSVSNRDQTLANSADVGMYLVASPHDTLFNRLLWAGHHRGNTIISSGFNTAGQGPILFTPGAQANGQGNSVVHATSTIGGYHFATINYDNASARTGTRLSVTNGLNATGARNGNLVLAIDRNNNGAGFGDKEWAFNLAAGSNNLVLTEDGVARTTFEAGGNVTVTGNLNLTGRIMGYDRVFGEFFSNVDQVAANTTSEFAITLNNTDIASDVSIVDNSNITIAKPGVYNIQYSVQLANSTNDEQDFSIWFRRNGTNMPNTNTEFTVVRSRTGASGKSVAVTNIFVDAAAGDVYQLMYAVTDVGLTIEQLPEQTTPFAKPATPSVLVTVTPVGA
jgi:hypothetical protein